MNSFAGRHYWVTGGSRGLGRAVCLRLLEAGATVTNVSRTEGKPVEGLGFVELDFSQQGESFHEALRRVMPIEARIDGIVQNAAVGYDDLVTNLNPESLEAMYRVNVTNPLILAREGIRNFLFHRCSGSIVWVGSVAARTGFKGLAAYGGTKAALEGVSGGVAREWGSRGIRSNVIACGFMETEMTGGLDGETRARIAKRSTLGKFADVGDAAAMVVHYLGDQTASVSGTVVTVGN